MHHGRPGGRWRKTATALVLFALTTIPGTAAWPSSAEDEASFRSEWETVRQNYERAIRGSQKRIAEIEARERAALASSERRAEKITRDAVAGVKAYLTGGGQGGRSAPKGDPGGERKRLHDSTTVLQKNFERIDAYLTRASEAAAAMSAHARQSGVLEKAAQTDAAAKEAGERLAARWERERAARERERELREREAAQRGRGRL